MILKKKIIDVGVFEYHYTKRELKRLVGCLRTNPESITSALNCFFEKNRPDADDILDFWLPLSEKLRRDLSRETEQVGVMTV
jgi:hypothetical protein